MTQMRLSQLLALPAELWLMVFDLLDDFSLWVICRQVSSSWRIEAERTFAKTRLGKLSIEIAYPYQFDWNGAKKKITCTAHIKSLLRFDEDSTRATFQIEFSETRLDFQLEPHIVDLPRRGAIMNSVLDYKERLQYRYICRQQCILGSYCNDIPLPDADICLEKMEISFEWKTYINEFFAPYAHAQHIAKTWLDCGTKTRRYADTMRDRDHSEPTPEGLEGPLPYWLYKHQNFVQACVAQVGRRHRKTGINIDLEDERQKQPLRGCIFQIWFRHKAALCDAFQRT